MPASGARAVQQLSSLWYQNLKNSPQSGADGLLPQTGSVLADNRPLSPVSEWAGWQHRRRRLAAGCLALQECFFFGKAKDGERRTDGRGQSVKMSAVPWCSILHLLCSRSPSLSPTLLSVLWEHPPCSSCPSMWPEQPRDLQFKLNSLASLGYTASSKAVFFSHFF